ncbi:MAG: hypothetical protein M1530_02505 [Candidatus Marsarchaeota archaeon]|nr:hypothetical protein [Candidatus Marsarchaeota archaeon]
MKVSDILQVLFILSIMVFLVGLLNGQDLVRACTLGMVALGFLSLLASWNAVPSVSMESRKALSLAVADTFIFMFVLLVAILLLRGFVFTSINLDYALFGTLLLAILMVRLLSLKVLDQ